MKVLVLFEESGKVTDAFRARGHEASSMDLLPSRGKNPGYHTQVDIWDLVYNANPICWEIFDLVIAFPPCTHLCVSGNRHYANTPERIKALWNIRALMNLPVKRLAIENPVGVISSEIRKPDQIIQPWQFGHPESKKTCLWLENLPKLTPTNILTLPESGRWNNQTPSGQNRLGPSENRARIRSETYQGIAEAMASQWG